MQNVVAHVHACTVFYSFMRVRVALAASARSITNPQLRTAAGAIPIGQKGLVERPNWGGLPEIEVQAIIERDLFPQNYVLSFEIDGTAYSVPMGDIVDLERQIHSQSLEPVFRRSIEAWRASHPGETPRMLDIGGRARSGRQRSDDYPGCDVSVMDIKADPGVDIVGDVHELSRLAPAETFDFALCVAVFEHLLMPWKAVIEINHVLRPGAVMLIFTHQTIGMHDRPWDFWRYSDDAWPALFNEATGYAIEQTLLADFMHIVPANYYASHPHGERAGGFQGSSVLVRKIGSPRVSWPVDARPLLREAYPG